MTADTSLKIAKNNGTSAIQTWSHGVSKFAAEAHAALNEVAGRACRLCPFRENRAMGGCIGEECPVYMVRKAVLLASKRAARATKGIYKARYAARVA